MEQQDHEGKVLDKDLVGDSTIYSPSTCCFIYQKTNMFLSNCNRNNCGFYRKELDKWSVKVGLVYVGAFKDKEEANKAFLKEKHRQALEHAELYNCHKIKKALSERFKPA